MNLRLMWLALNIIGFLFVSVNFGFDAKEAFHVYLHGKNGERRRTTNRRLVNSFAFFSAIIAFSMLSVDAFLEPHQVTERGLLFNLGVVALLLVNLNIIIASFHSLSHRAEDFRLAKLYDTDGKKYEDAKKNQRLKGLKLLKYAY